VTTGLSDSMNYCFVLDFFRVNVGTAFKCAQNIHWYCPLVLTFLCSVTSSYIKTGTSLCSLFPYLITEQNDDIEPTLLSQKLKTNLLWAESASKLYRLSNRCLSAKLVPTFADRGYHVVSVTDPYSRNLAF
jgi:hypothetical protein